MIKRQSINSRKLHIKSNTDGLLKCKFIKGKEYKLAQNRKTEMIYNMNRD
jgi:hypothetical protein